MQQAAEGAAREERARAASCPWWVQQGYPPFEEDEAGWPHAGQVVRYFRQRKRRPDGKCWTQADLARALGISERAVRNMEERKEGLDSISRRRFLAETLAIPPVLLGLAEMPGSGGVSAALREQVGPAVITRRAVDPEAAAQRLEALWDRHYTGDASAGWSEIQSMISALYEAIPFARARTDRSLIRLLAGYHLLGGYLARDQLFIDHSLEHLHRAAHWADVLQDPVLLGEACYRQEITLLDAGRYDAALELAESLQEQGVLTKLPGELRQALLLQQCLITAYAHRQQRFPAAADRGLIRELDRLVIQGEERAILTDPFHLRLDRGRREQIRAEALLVIGWPREALRALPATRKDGMPRRTAYSDLLEARAYADLSQYEMSAELAQEAVKQMEQLHSRLNLAKIRQLVDQLAASPFGSAPEVARLRALLAGPRRGKPGPQSV
ncbi:helix-turn-helix transcriptional regulator [Thermogemmatispora onikobensis]|uniref:helix-turn-helix transcriptional regulator n=1 Tax=Thermogemmatispora onikobensis TaxID=732234 RepID=UPI0008537612|nr:helix-turn-helix transcriptional regulator [Thermogemmatispora onikobensis]